MKIYLMLITSVLVFIMSINAFSSEEQERLYLIQIMNQLNAIKPLIVSAEREQPKKNRILFHYSGYRDTKDQYHPGLLGDINAIEIGIQKKLNHVPNEPHSFTPIQGDYIHHHRD